jgi:hypothetical protein
MENFKPKSDRMITSREKKFLISEGFNWCPCCKSCKTLDHFASLKVKYCKSCNVIKSTKWQEKNRKKVNKKAVERRNRNKEKYRAREKQYEEKNKEHLEEKAKLYRERNKEKIKATQQKYYQKNKEKTFERNQKWWEKAKLDPIHALARRVRDRTRECFRLKRIPKSQNTMSMLGCTWEELKNHIESLFTDGMCWERLSEIHLDHIIPLSSAKNEEDLIKLAHYTNLQPLWASDNISKGNRL